jgi:hypothetical protein
MNFQSHDVEFVRALLQRAHNSQLDWQGGKRWLTATLDGFNISVSTKPNFTGPAVVVRSRSQGLVVRVDEATLLAPAAPNTATTARPLAPAFADVVDGAALSKKHFGRKWMGRRQPFAWLPTRLFSSNQELFPLDFPHA